MAQESELIDFAASRLTRSRTAANARAAIEEATQIQDRVAHVLAKAELAVLSGLDASEFIAEAQDAVARLAKQLTFAAALDERATLARARRSA